MRRRQRRRSGGSKSRACRRSCQPRYGSTMLNVGDGLSNSATNRAMSMRLPLIETSLPKSRSVAPARPIISHSLVRAPRPLRRGPSRWHAHVPALGVPRAYRRVGARTYSRQGARHHAVLWVGRQSPARDAASGRARRSRAAAPDRPRTTTGADRGSPRGLSLSGCPVRRLRHHPSRHVGSRYILP